MSKKNINILLIALITFSAYCALTVGETWDQKDNLLRGKITLDFLFSLGKIDNQIFVAGCYNGSGIGVGTFFGEQIALMASKQDSEKISIIKERKKPNWLPPQPFLNIGIYSRLFYERIKSRSDL